VQGFCTYFGISYALLYHKKDRNTSIIKGLTPVQQALIKEAVLLESKNFDVICHKKNLRWSVMLQLSQPDEKQSSGGHGWPEPRCGARTPLHRDDSFSSGKIYCNRHSIWFFVD